MILAIADSSLPVAPRSNVTYAPRDSMIRAIEGYFGDGNRVDGIS